jgi:DNA-binding MarR family transcriptional regulator
MARPQSDYNLQILQAIASGTPITQRSLARRMGVALGLTNLLLRRLAAKGYVKVSRMGTRHVRYLMTASGWEALALETRRSLENTVHLYTQTREQIRTSLSLVSKNVTPDALGKKRIVFYGAGDVAEIAYISLQTTDLTLVAIVDDQRTGRFFDLEISGQEALTAQAVGESTFSHVVITSLRQADAIRERLAARDVPADRVFCL